MDMTNKRLVWKSWDKCNKWKWKINSGNLAWRYKLQTAETARRLEKAERFTNQNAKTKVIKPPY